MRRRPVERRAQGWRQPVQRILLHATTPNQNLQGDNLTDELIARGAGGQCPSIRDIYDVNGALGGPIMRDKLWFFTAHRHWGDTIRGAILRECRLAGQLDVTRPTRPAVRGGGVVQLATTSA